MPAPILTTSPFPLVRGRDREQNEDNGSRGTRSNHSNIDMRVRKSNRTVGTRRIYDSLKKDCACACKNFIYSVGCRLMGDGQKTMKYCVFCFACGQRGIFPECKWLFLQKFVGTVTCNTVLLGFQLSRSCYPNRRNAFRELQNLACFGTFCWSVELRESWHLVVCEWMNKNSA